MLTATTATATAAVDTSHASRYDVRTEPHPPDLYAALPEHEVDGYNVVREGGFAAVTKKHVRALRDLGYLVVADAFTVDDVTETLEALSRCVASDAFNEAALETERGCAAGEFVIADGGDRAVLQWESFATGATEAQLRTLSTVRKLQGIVAFDESLRRVAYDPALLRVVASAFPRGSDGAECDPGDLEVWQSLALLKPPGGKKAVCKLDPSLKR